MAVNYNFEWDPKKADINRDQHGINFEEGSTVFLDQNALSIFDTGHSETEDRWITMGYLEKEECWSCAIHTAKKVKNQFQSEFFQLVKQPNKKSKHMVK